MQLDYPSVAKPCTCFVVPKGAICHSRTRAHPAKIMKIRHLAASALTRPDFAHPSPGLAGVLSEIDRQLRVLATKVLKTTRCTSRERFGRGHEGDDSNGRTSAMAAFAARYSSFCAEPSRRRQRISGVRHCPQRFRRRYARCRSPFYSFRGAGFARNSQRSHWRFG